MRARLLLSTAAWLLALSATAHAETPITPDPAAPKGKLPDTARPTAYRLSFIIDPDQPRFSGQDEIDVTVKAPTSVLYLHGRDLNVALVTAKVGGKVIPARYTQVDKTGVVRLDFASPLPAGAATLSFTYDGAFGDGASGLYRVKVADKWYSWTQFESIDARAAFPSFDEPGFKTPFTLRVMTKVGDRVTGNAPESEVRRVAVDPQSGAAKFLRAAGKPVPAAMEEHVFAPTRPLPTYLVAVHTGPFVRVDGTVARDPERSSPLPLGAVATQAQKDKMGYVMAESPRIVQLLEKYFGEPFPFPKLDQIGSPIMPGAMENAGADTYGDGIIYLPPNASTGNKQQFGMIVAHELAHQWFGDLVTPAWWDDIWLNESFANWMGYRIGNEWRPELNIGVGGLAEGFNAMNTDALEVGRPIHQAIATNNEIDSAFDSITYGKGGQVIAMIAAYLGDEKFRDGVRLHLKRHAYGNATSEQFFQSLADSAKDPRVLAALKSFVDQAGVPVVDLVRNGTTLTATQSRYAFLGSTPRAAQWTIPFCYRPIEGTRACTLLDRPSVTIAAPVGGFVPNAGGTGYYRFNLAPADWQTLIAQSAVLTSGEAIAVQDSLWAAFRAGKVPAGLLITAAKAMTANPDSNAAVSGGGRLSGLRDRGLIADAQLPAYRRLMGSLYAPMLAKIGFDPTAGAHAADTPDRQKLRQSLVALLADDAADKAVDDRLVAAATRYLGGDHTALDPAFLYAGFTAYERSGGVTAAQKLVSLALSSEDADVRSSALVAAGASGRRDVQDYLLGLKDPRLRGFDRLLVIQSLTGTPGTVTSAGDWLLAHYDELRAGGNGVFITSRLPGALGSQCGVDRAARIEAVLGPKVRAAGAGVLDFERVVETIRHCGALRDAKAGEIAAAIAAS